MKGSDPCVFPKRYGCFFMKEIQRQIKEHDFSPVYLLTGDEEYLAIQAKNALKQALVHEDDAMNYTLFDSPNVDIHELTELARTMPFFAEKRVIALEKTGIIKSGKDAFIDILDHLPPTTCLILWEAEADKRSKVYKWIKKNGCVREFLKKDQTEKTLASWVASMLHQSGKKIRERDALYFLERVGEDMFQIKNETDKLIAYVGDRDVVERSDIEASASEEVMNKIFDLITAIAEGRKSRAMAYYNDLLLLKEPPMRILFLILRQYRILLLLLDLRSRGSSHKEMAQAAGIPAFAVRKNLSQLSGYDKAELEQCISSCLETEEAVKTGRMTDSNVLEVLIMSMLEKNE